MSPHFFSITERRGQALVESLVALGVLVMGFLGSFSLLTNSLSLNRVVADNYAASYLAAEGIEIVKNLIDHNQILRNTTSPGTAWDANIPEGTWEVQWDDLVINQSRPYAGQFLRFDPTANLYSYSSGSSGSRVTAFKRTINIQKPTDQIIIKSTVDWTTRGGASFSTTLEDHFYKWRP